MINTTELTAKEKIDMELVEETLQGIADLDNENKKYILGYIFGKQEEKAKWEKIAQSEESKAS